MMDTETLTVHLCVLAAGWVSGEAHVLSWLQLGVGEVAAVQPSGASPCPGPEAASFSLQRLPHSGLWICATLHTGTAGFHQLSSDQCLLFCSFMVSQLYGITSTVFFSTFKNLDPLLLPLHSLFHFKNPAWKLLRFEMMGLGDRQL